MSYRCTSIVRSTTLTVQAQQSTKVELGCLEELHLPYVHILKRVDSLCRLLNLTTNDLGNELGSQLLQRAAAGLSLHNLGHLLPDGANLRTAGIRRLLDLVWSSLGEGNGEDAEKIVVGGLDNNVALDESLPLADERAELVRSEVHAVEVGQAVAALDLVDTELDLAEGVVLIFLEIGEGDFEDTALKSVVGVLETSGAVYEGLSDTVRIISSEFDCSSS